MKLITILALIPAPCVVAQLPAERAAEIRQAVQHSRMSEAGVAMLISRAAAKLRDEQVSSLRRQTAEPWICLKVGCGYSNSCTPSAMVAGFEISRNDDDLSIAPWTDGVDSEPAGEQELLEKGDAEKLLDEIVLHFLVAVTSVHPIEISGPAPEDVEQLEKWRADYIAAGGTVRGCESYWIDVRFTTQDGGVVRIKNYYADPPPEEFGNWVSRYSSEKVRKLVRLVTSK